MNKQQEFIICSAIRMDDSDKIYYGHRHSHCLDAMKGEMSWTMNRQEIYKLKITQGFATNTNRFVDREEALIIALENNQIIDTTQIRGNQLYSEDLY